jgi:hypothetical protein
MTNDARKADSSEGPRMAPDCYTLTVNLPAFVYETLAERAQAADQSVDVYVADLLGQVTTFGEPVEMVDAQDAAEQLRRDLALVHRVADDLANELGQMMAVDFEDEAGPAQPVDERDDSGRTPGAAEGAST